MKSRCPPGRTIVGTANVPSEQADVVLDVFRHIEREHQIESRVGQGAPRVHACGKPERCHDVVVVVGVDAGQLRVEAQVLQEPRREPCIARADVENVVRRECAGLDQSTQEELEASPLPRMADPRARS